jgi:hypothetical protein
MTIEEHRERAAARAIGAGIGIAVLISRNPRAVILAAGTMLKGAPLVLRRAQQGAINKIDNIIKNNAKPHDFEGVRKELQGIPNGGGSCNGNATVGHRPEGRNQESGRKPEEPESG